MREPMPKRRRKKQRKVQSGCGSGCFKFVIFIAVMILLAVFLVNKYNSSDISSNIKKKQYPIKYEHFVDKYSEKYGLDRYLVLAVIRTESRFDVYAVSSADAKGLMQLTDETGSHVAKKIGLTKYTNDMLFDPETNIQLGCCYLSELISKYKNDVDTALAAYNGGPGNVDKWLSNDEYTDGTGKLQTIPYAETRNYVKKVNEAMNMYKSLY